MTFNIVFVFFHSIPAYGGTYIFVFMAITATLAAYALAGSKNTKPQHWALSGVIWGTAAATAAAAAAIRSKLFPFRASMKFVVHFWKIWQGSLSLINCFKILFTQYIQFKTRITNVSHECAATFLLRVFAAAALRLRLRLRRLRLQNIREFACAKQLTCRVASCPKEERKFQLVNYF